MGASIIPAVGSVLSQVQSLGKEVHDYRPARAIELGKIAIAGDIGIAGGTAADNLTAARIVLDGTKTSATAAGKAAYAQVWQTLLTSYPAIAAAAQAAGPLPDPPGGGLHTPSLGQPLQSIPYGSGEPGSFQAAWSNFVGQVRTSAAQDVAGLASQFGTAAANAIAPGSGTTIIPTNTTTLVIVGAIVLLLAIVALRGGKKA